MMPDKLTIVSEIFAPRLDILSGEVCDDRIKIVFNQPEVEYPYCGGELVLSVREATITDDSGTRHSLEDMIALCEAYWEEWAKRNEKK